LHDFSYWDYEEEFLKRFYNSREAPERILLLDGTMKKYADYFRHTRLFQEELPRVLPFRDLLFKRIKRRIKLRRKLDGHPPVPKTTADGN
jgi:hypothetical protein